MTADPTQTTARAELTPAYVRNVTFPTTRSRGLGLDESKVAAFKERVADTIDVLTARIDERDREIEQLRRKVVDPQNKANVDQAVSILAKAQQTAEAVMAEADAYSRQVAQEARSTFDAARRRAADLIAEADRVAKKAADESAAKRDEYQQEAIWWGTYRDSLINQLQLFISSLGDHLSEAQKQARAAASPQSHGVSASAQPSESPSVRQVTLTPGMPVSLGKAPVPPNGEPADQREP